MNNIPKKLRKELASDLYYKKCLRRKEGNCKGRITFEHSFYYAGKQIQEKFSIIPLCEFHHLGIGLNKKINRWFAINRMIPEDEKKYFKVNWKKERIILNKLFGKPK